MIDRIYVFVTGIQSSTAPDPGTPSGTSDVVPLSYFGTVAEQVAVSGTRNSINTAFTVPNTPLAQWPFSLYVNGSKMVLGTDYTRIGAAITIPGGLTANQVPTADYRY